MEEIKKCKKRGCEEMWSVRIVVSIAYLILNQTHRTKKKTIANCFRRDIGTKCARSNVFSMFTTSKCVCFMYFVN